MFGEIKIRKADDVPVKNEVEPVLRPRARRRRPKTREIKHGKSGNPAIPPAETTASPTNQGPPNHPGDDKGSFEAAVGPITERGLRIHPPSRSNGAAKHYAVLDGHCVRSREYGHAVQPRGSVHRI